MPASRNFFALWPDEAVRRQLAEAATGWPEDAGRRVPAENLHVTLVFLGAVDAATRDRLMDGAGRIRAAPFALSIERSGIWPRARIGWLGTRDTPAELLALVGDLTTLVRECGLRPEKRAYRPHVTVLRKLRGRRRGPRIEPIHWEINEFCLVESTPAEEGSAYKVLRSWSLSGA